jgi:hypothetical protein
MASQFGFQSLERRMLLSAAVSQINFGDFSSTENLVGNGYAQGDRGAMNHEGVLHMTDGSDHQARSVWYGSAVPIERFTTHFSYRVGGGDKTADGLTFTILNGQTSTLGADGRGLGYGNIGGASQAIAFNMFNFAKYGSTFGFASNGERPATNTDMGAIDLHSGHTFKVTVSYDGRELDVNVTDASDRTKSFNASKRIDLPAAIGAKEAIVGFTAATGDNSSDQEILSWNYSGSSTPSIAAVANASPSPVRGTSTVLSVLGADDSAGEQNLSYTWKVLRKPSDAPMPTFSANGTNEAKETTARFARDGSYRFRVIATNSGGLSATSDVTVRVIQKATLVRLTSHKMEVPVGGTIDYHATLLDQFNNAMRAQPAFTYSVQSGPGTIEAETGLFTAPSDSTGHVIVAATANGIAGTVGATVVPETLPSLLPAPVPGIR